MTRTYTARALCTLASLLCVTALGGCPNTDPDTGSGGSGGAVEAGKGEAGKAGAAPQAGKTGQVAGQTGKAGAASPTAGRSGAAGKHAAGGSGGHVSTDEDAGTSARCGTRGATSCGADEFCNYEPDKDCGGTDRGGVCEDKPQVCTDIFMPVCGCDMHTHSSKCTAHSAGVSVLHDGACTATECESIGGHTVLSNGASTPMCKADEEAFGIAGTLEGGLCCLPKKTQAGLGKTCGGFAALKCASGEFCSYEASADGQGCDGKIADAAGTCQTQPSACTREYKPVCGCDHRSYGTLCTAHAEGVSMLHDGSCTVKDCEAVSGRVAVGIGPAPMCNSDEKELTSIIHDDGSMAIEGMLCCINK